MQYNSDQRIPYSFSRQNTNEVFYKNFLLSHTLQTHENSDNSLQRQLKMQDGQLNKYNKYIKSLDEEINYLKQALRTAQSLISQYQNSNGILRDQNIKLKHLLEQNQQKASSINKALTKLFTNNNKSKQKSTNELYQQIIFYNQSDKTQQKFIINQSLKKHNSSNYLSGFKSDTNFLFNSHLLSSAQRDNFESTAHDLNSLQFYKKICRRGGYQAVTNRNQWNLVGTQLLSNKQGSSLKNFYYEYLYPYEQKYYFGKQMQAQLPNMICGQPRKIIKLDTNAQLDQINTNQSIAKIPVRQQPSKTLQQQIRKRFQQQQKVRKIFYINKNKLIQTKAQSKKIILGLQPFMDRKDIIYSLNMLIVYSVNTSSPFLFQNNQKIFNAIVNFTNSIYKLKKVQDYQDLRVITLIFRNLTLNPINLKFILGTSIFQLFVKIFNQGVDKQCSKNIIDMMSGLVKVGWDCNRIIQNINDALLNSQKQSIKDMIELLRGLVDERQQNLFNIIPDNLKIINRILLNKQIDIDVKQQLFQIISFVTQSSLQARQTISKNHFLVGIIVGILQNMRNHQKLTQLSILTLNNISNSMNGKSLIKQFQNQLMIIGFTDDSLAGILSHILADVAAL